VDFLGQLIMKLRVLFSTYRVLTLLLLLLCSGATVRTVQDTSEAPASGGEELALRQNAAESGDQNGAVSWVFGVIGLVVVLALANAVWEAPEDSLLGFARHLGRPLKAKALFLPVHYGVGRQGVAPGMEYRGYLETLSSRQALVVTGEPLVPGTPVVLAVDSPEIPGCRAMTLTGSIRRCEPVKDEASLYHITIALAARDRVVDGRLNAFIHALRHEAQPV